MSNRDTNMGADITKSLSDLRAPTVIEPPQRVIMGFGDSAGFELMQRGAKLLAASTLVPKDYQQNIPNCCIALNMASRLGADPLLVMQSLYIVHGRPGWSAQFLIATMNQCGRFSAIRYRWSGAENTDAWSCTAYTRELKSGDPIEGPTVSIALAKKEGWYQKTGSKWQTIPQLMLMYRAGAWLVRTHAPELSMGLQTEEELHDVYDAQKGVDGRYVVSTDDWGKPPVATVSARPDPYSVDESKQMLNAAGDLATLEGAWKLIMNSHPLDQDIDVTVESLYRFRKETLTGAK